MLKQLKIILTLLLFSCFHISASSLSSCNENITSVEQLVSRLHYFVDNSLGHINICIQPGEYTLPQNFAINIANASDITITAPAGGVKILSSFYNLGTALNGNVVHIVNSSNISLVNLELVNTTRYQESEPHKHSQSVKSENSSLSIISSKLSSLGKGTLSLFDSSVYISDSIYNCFYFCIGLKNSVAESNNNVYYINDQSNNFDEHAAFWVENSDLTINGGQVSFITGLGFVAGANSPSNSINVNNVSINGTDRMVGWVPLHGNYKNLAVNLTGVYAKTLKPYFCIIWQNYECTTGLEKGDDPIDGSVDMSVVKQRVNTSNNFYSYKKPPIKTSKLVVVDGDHSSGQNIFELNQFYVDNGIYLESGAAISWSTTPISAFAGWLDSNDYVDFGDFHINGTQQLITINNGPGDGAIAVSELNFVNGTSSLKFWKNWSEIPNNWLSNWRKMVVGKFENSSTSQLLYLSDNSIVRDEILSIYRLEGFSGLFHVGSITKNPNHTSIFAGWTDSNDHILAGNFLGERNDQVFLMNSDGQGGMIQLLGISLTNGISQKFWQEWSSQSTNEISSWINAGAKVIAGDFLGNSKDQVAIINPDTFSGGVLIIQHDYFSNSFQIVYKKTWVQMGINPFFKVVSGNAFKTTVKLSSVQM